MVGGINDSYQFIWDQDGVRIRFYGKITADGILEAKKEFHGDHRFENQKYSIWDFSNATGSEVQPDHIPMLLAYHVGASFTLPRHKIALVSPFDSVKDLLDYFLSESRNSGIAWEFAVFSSEADALEWGNNKREFTQL